MKQLDALRERSARLRQLLGLCDDTELALGSDVMSTALEGYALLKVLGKGSGLEELHHAAWDTLLQAKVALGASAVVLNSIAAFTVHRRLQCLNAQDMVGYQRFNLWHERIGIGCVLSIAGAIVVGGYRIAV